MSATLAQLGGPVLKWWKTLSTGWTLIWTIICAGIVTGVFGSMAVRRRQTAADLKKVQNQTRAKIEAEQSESKSAVLTAEAFKAGAEAKVHEDLAAQYEAKVLAAKARVEQIKKEMAGGH